MFMREIEWREKKKEWERKKYNLRDIYIDSSKNMVLYVE